MEIKIYGVSFSTPSTRRLLDGVTMPVSHRLWRPPRASFLAAERDKRLPRDDTQARRFVDLYAWRDAAARRVDESPHAVCPAAALVEFSKRAPRDVDALGIAFEPLPPYIACDAFGLRGELLARIGRWA